MENVTDRTSNPFDMRPPCREKQGGGGRTVPGYGDANADFHVIGDHPGVHGGTNTGVPFTETVSGRRMQNLLYETSFLEEPYSDRPTVSNLFLSYIYMCSSDDGPPTDEDYTELERFFDAELRAINAHILLPVGERATEHVLREYTTQRHKLTLDMTQLHARQIRGRGFLVVPVNEPAEWSDSERDRLAETVREVLESDYRQTKGVATRFG